MNFLPMPNNLTCGNQNVTIKDPCKIFFHVKIAETNNEHVSELISFQMKKSFHCSLSNFVLSPTIEATLIGFEYKVDVQIDNTELKSVFTTAEESYLVNINKEGSNIAAKTYVGFVRGL
jgi:hypothetical protein